MHFSSGGGWGHETIYPLDATGPSLPFLRGPLLTTLLHVETVTSLPFHPKNECLILWVASSG